MAVLGGNSCFIFLLRNSWQWTVGREETITAHFPLPTFIVFCLRSEKLIDRIAGLSDRIALRRLLILRDETPQLRRPKNNPSVG